jgi:predicted PurR-regulated permease PerM
VLSATVAVLCFIGLAALGITLAPALAVLQGIMEFVPILGPWIGGAIGVIVILAVAPQKVIWAIGVYLGVQLLENILLVPRIHGGYLRIHPALILVLLPLGAYIAGLWGIILIVPLTATAVEIYKYVRDSLKAGEKQQSA